MSNHKAHDQPTKTTAIEGEVVLHGPGHVGLSMTPEAAAETARRLSKSAGQASKQSSRSRVSR